MIHSAKRESIENEAAVYVVVLMDSCPENRERIQRHDECRFWISFQASATQLMTLTRRRFVCPVTAAGSVPLLTVPLSSAARWQS